MKSYYDYTIQDWIKEINLDSYRVRPFVVVDPIDPNGLLYLSQHEYQRLVTTALANQTTLIVVARPGQTSMIEAIKSGVNAQTASTFPTASESVPLTNTDSQGKVIPEKENPTSVEASKVEIRKPVPSETTTSPISGPGIKTGSTDGESSDSTPPQTLPLNQDSTLRVTRSNPSGGRTPRESALSSRKSLFHAKGLAHLIEDPYLKDGDPDVDVSTLNLLFKNLKRFWSRGASQSDLKWYTVQGQGNRQRFTSMVTVTNRNVSKVFTSWTRSLLFWNAVKRTGAMDSAVKQIWKVLDARFRNHGALQTIKFLKVSLFVVNGYLGGNPEVHPWKLGTPLELANGLPRWLPLLVRASIRARALPSIRVWVSLLNSYKGIYAEHKAPDLRTISGAPVDLFDHELWLRDMAEDFWEELKALGAKRFTMPAITSQAWAPMTKASPQGSNSLLDAHMSARVWRASGNRALEQWFVATRMTWLYDAFFDFAYLGERIPFNPQLPIHHLGRLSAKLEPAGKVRVFAMVDYWTQKALRPVHDWMFSILKKITSDATFNQDGAFESYVAEVPRGHYCYDLTSATDNVPQGLYKIMLRPAMGRCVDQWMDLLVNRTFVHPDIKPAVEGQFVFPTYGQLREQLIVFFNKINASLNEIRHFPVGKYTKKDFAPNLRNQDGSEVTNWFTTSYNYPIPEGMIDNDPCFAVRYTRGQPMGALSSWASLALVHHFVVYLALRKVFKKGSPEYTANLFKNYRVLGDDIVLGNPDIASAYLDVTRILGIPINLAKSEVSPITDEPRSGGLAVFANQVKLFTTDISPASLREDLAIDTHLARFELVRRFLRRGYFQKWTTLPGLTANGAAAPSALAISGLLRGLLYPAQWDRVKSMMFKGLLSLELRLLLMSLLFPRGTNVTREYNRQAIEAIIILSNKSNPLAKIQDLFEGGPPIVPSVHVIKFMQYQFKYYLTNYIELRAKVSAYRWRLLEFLDEDPDAPENWDPGVFKPKTLEARTIKFHITHCAEALNAKLSREESSLLLARPITSYKTHDEMESHLSKAISLLHRLIDDLPPVSREISELLAPNREVDGEKSFANVLDKNLISSWWTYVSQWSRDPSRKLDLFAQAVLPDDSPSLRYAEVFSGQLDWYDPMKKLGKGWNTHQAPGIGWGNTPIEILTHFPYVLDVVLVPGDMWDSTKQDIEIESNTSIRYCFMLEETRTEYLENLRDHQWYGNQYQENCSPQRPHQLFLFQSSTGTDRTT